MPVLTWLTREHDLKSAQNAPYRLLEETPELSAGDATTENMLIHGDNLDALKALLPYYAGQGTSKPGALLTTASWGTSARRGATC